jgi:hypothetical protein
MGKAWDEWVHVSDGEGEHVCEILGVECGDQEWVHGDKNFEEG